MKDDQADPAVLDGFIEGLLKFLRPRLTVVVTEHDLILAQVRRKENGRRHFARFIAGLEEGGDIDLETTRILERLLHKWRRFTPLMIVLPIQNDHAQPGRLLRLERSTQDHEEQRADAHDASHAMLSSIIALHLQLFVWTG